MSLKERHDGAAEAESVAREIEACEDWPWHDGQIIEMATEIVGQIKSLKTKDER